MTTKAVHDFDGPLGASLNPLQRLGANSKFQSVPIVGFAEAICGYHERAKDE